MRLDLLPNQYQRTGPLRLFPDYAAAIRTSVGGR